MVPTSPFIENGTEHQIWIPKIKPGTAQNFLLYLPAVQHQSMAWTTDLQTGHGFNPMSFLQWMHVLSFACRRVTFFTSELFEATT